MHRHGDGEGDADEETLEAALDMAITNGMGKNSLETSAGQKGARLRWQVVNERKGMASKFGGKLYSRTKKRVS